MHKRELHLAVHLMGSGWFQSAWRTPEADPRAFIDIEHLQQCARLAEHGTLDAVFLADTPHLVISDVGRVPPYGLEPTVSLAAVAAVTQRIGLIATLSTTFNEPYNVARRIASLDHVSHGRAGWNIVTTRSRAAARNFGGDIIDEATGRYARATEFMEIVGGLWASWGDGAFVGDKATGVFADPEYLRPLTYTGQYYSVRGALSMPSPPQKRPVLVQAGYSDAGLDFAARFADILFTVQNDIDTAQRFYGEMKARVAAHGRDPGRFLILPALPLVLGRTKAHAEARWWELTELMSGESSVANLAQRLRVPEQLLALDERLPFGSLPAADTLPEVERGWFEYAMNLAADQDLSVRQLIQRLGRGATAFVTGTPEEIADRIEEWHATNACDGFMLNPDVLPSGLRTIVDEVVPILRQRGCFRSEYSGQTLRDHLGLTL